MGWTRTVGNRRDPRGDEPHDDEWEQQLRECDASAAMQHLLSVENTWHRYFVTAPLAKTENQEAEGPMLWG